MEIIDIAVITEDKEYAAALAWAITRNTQGMEVRVFDGFKSFNETSYEMAHDTQNLLRKTGNRRMFDVLMTDLGEYEAERLMEIARNNEEAPLILRLADRKSDESECENAVYKYKNVKEMIRDTYSLLSVKRGIQMISDAHHDMDVFCFASERGGCGCSKISLDFAGELVRSAGKKVIYITLDQFPEAWNIEAEEEGDPAVPGDHLDRDQRERTLKQFIYHILYNSQSKGYVSTGSYLREDNRGVDHFKVKKGLNPLLELDHDGYVRFLKKILSDGMHDSVVFDCGAQLTMQMIKTFELSRKIYIIRDHRGESAGWRDYVGRLMGNGMRKKVVLINTKDPDAVRKVTDKAIFA